MIEKAVVWLGLLVVCLVAPVVFGCLFAPVQRAASEPNNIGDARRCDFCLEAHDAPVRFVAGPNVQICELCIHRLNDQLIGSSHGKKSRLRSLEATVQSAKLLTPD